MFFTHMHVIRLWFKLKNYKQCLATFKFFDQGVLSLKKAAE